MLIKYHHTEFLVASEGEISQVKSQDDLNSLFYILFDKHGVASGFGGFEIVFALSRIFFHDEAHIPKKLIKIFLKFQKSINMTESL